MNIIHAQLRLNCSNLNSHLVSLHVKDDPSCICGHNVENAYHYLLSCPLYVNERQKLFDFVSTKCNVTLDILLYCNDDLSLEDNIDIFLHVHEFIKMSKRF